MEINRESRILDIVEIYPQMEEIFKPYDDVIGKCVMCHHLFDTLEDFATQYNMDLEVLLNSLKSRID